MIRHTGNVYDGEDRRVVPYSNLEVEILHKLEELNKKEPEPVKEDKPKITIQVIVQVLALLATGLGLYVTSHDEQVKMQTDFRNFQERYKDDQNRHNDTHNRIFDELKDLKRETESLDSTIQQLYSMRVKK